MADTKISALPAAASITADDLLVIVDDPGGVPVTKKITFADFEASSTIDLVSATFVTASGATAVTTDNSLGVFFDVPVTGIDVATHAWTLGIDGSPVLRVSAVGDGAGSITSPKVKVNGIFDVEAIGDVQFINLQTAPSGVVGTSTGGITMTTGTPDAADGATDAGQVGEMLFQTGDGGASSVTNLPSSGGIIEINTGQGGAGNATDPSGDGGNITFLARGAGTNGGGGLGNNGQVSFVAGTGGNNSVILQDDLRWSFTGNTRLIADNFGLTWNTKLAIGADAAIGGHGGINAFVDISDTIVDFSAGALWSPMLSIYGLDPNATMVGTDVFAHDFEVFTYAGNGEDFSILNAGVFLAQHNGTGDVSTLSGLEVDTLNNSVAGTITQLIGLNFITGNIGTGTITDNIGILVNTPSNSGTIVNNYGLFIQNQSGATTLNYAIFSEGGTILSGGRFEETTGANVAAANDLTLGNDGNVFVITGNTQVNAITTTGWVAGSSVIFIFTGSPTVKHNTAGGAGTAPILLDSSVDLAAAVNTVLELVYDGTNWQQVALKSA